MQTTLIWSPVSLAAAASAAFFTEVTRKGFESTERMMSEPYMTAGPALARHFIRGAPPGFRMTHHREQQMSKRNGEQQGAQDHAEGQQPHGGDLELGEPRQQAMAHRSRDAVLDRALRGGIHNEEFERDRPGANPVGSSAEIQENKNHAHGQREDEQGPHAEPKPPTAG